MNPWYSAAAGYLLGAALFADGQRAPTWVRWFFIVLAVIDLWLGSLL